MKISSKSIKKKAEELGFQKVGIARAEKTPQEKSDLDSWLMQGNHASMAWMMNRKDERGNIHKYFPAARSVIAVGMNYYTVKNQDDLRSDYKFSNYAWGDDYHTVLKKQLYQLLNWIKENNPKVIFL